MDLSRVYSCFFKNQTQLLPAKAPTVGHCCHGCTALRGISFWTPKGSHCALLRRATCDNGVGTVDGNLKSNEFSHRLDGAKTGGKTNGRETTKTSTGDRWISGWYQQYVSKDWIQWGVLHFSSYLGVSLCFFSKNLPPQTKDFCGFWCVWGGNVGKAGLQHRKRERETTMRYDKAAKLKERLEEGEARLFFQRPQVWFLTVVLQVPNLLSKNTS